MSTAPFAYTAADDIAKEEGEEERSREEGAGGQCIDCGQANALLFGTRVYVPPFRTCATRIFIHGVHTCIYIYIYTHAYVYIYIGGRRARMYKTTRGDRVPAYLSD